MSIPLNAFGQPFHNGLPANGFGQPFRDSRVEDRVTSQARSAASAQRAWQGAMNSGIRRQSSAARRGNPRALGIISQLGPAQPVGSAPDSQGIARGGLINNNVDMEEAAFEQARRNAALGLGQLPAWGAPMAPSGLGGSMAPGASSWGSAGPTQTPLNALPDDTPGNASRMARSMAGFTVQPTFQTQPTFPTPTAALQAPTLAPREPTMFEIAREAVKAKAREQQEMGLRDKMLPGGTVQRTLPGIGTKITTEGGLKAIKGRDRADGGYNFGASSQTPTPVAEKSFGGMPGLSFFQEAANRQGIGNKFASPQANSRQNLLEAAVQRGFASRTRR